MYKIILSMMGIIYASSPLAAATDSTMDSPMTAVGGAGAAAPIFFVDDVASSISSFDTYRRMATSSDPFLKIRALHASLEGTGTPVEEESLVRAGNWNVDDRILMEVEPMDRIPNMFLARDYKAHIKRAPISEHERLRDELEQKLCENTRIVGALIAMRFDSGILSSRDGENKPVVWVLSDGHWKPSYDYVEPPAGAGVLAATKDRLSKICADRLRDQKPESELLKNACLGILGENHRFREIVLRSSYLYAQHVELLMFNYLIEELEKKMDDDFTEYDRLGGIVSELLEGRQHAQVENIPEFTSLIEEARQMQSEVIRRCWTRVNGEFPPLETKRKECKDIMCQMELELEFLKNADSATPLYVLMGAHKEALAREKREYFLGAKAALEASLTPFLIARLTAYTSSSAHGSAGVSVLHASDAAPAAVGGCGGAAGGAGAGSGAMLSGGKL